MENLHKPECREWISESINVKNFLTEWICAPHNASIVRKTTNDLMRSCGITTEELETLEEECNENSLSCDFEAEVELTNSFEIPEGVELETVKSQKRDVDKRNACPSYKLFIYNNSKYINYPPSKTLANLRRVEASADFKEALLPDVALTVEVHRPEKSCRRCFVQTSARFPLFVVDQDLLVLGQQNLTALRDKIKCITEYARPGDFSNDPSTESVGEREITGNSGFFFINDTFYNDRRDVDSQDYSKAILDWAKTAYGIGPFNTADMATAKFSDLTIRLGYPYVYVHDGDCEHLLVFSDLRILNKEDNLDISAYPMNNMLISKLPLVCMVCDKRIAKWVVSKSPRVPEDTYVFCEECFYCFNYTADGEKIGEFEARKYIDRTVLE